MIVGGGKGRRAQPYITMWFGNWFVDLKDFKNDWHGIYFHSITTPVPSLELVLDVAEVVPYLTRQLLFIIYVGSNLVGSCIREPVYKERKTQLNRSLISLSINLCFRSTLPVINIHTINGE